MQTDTDRTWYRFGVLERRGVVLGLSWSQVIVLAAAAVVAVIVLALGGLAGLVAAIALLLLALFVSFKRKSGRPLVHWLPIASTYAARRLFGLTSYRSRAPFKGTRVRMPLDENGEIPDDAPVKVVEGPEHTPEVLGELELLEISDRSGEPFAFYADRDRTVFGTAVLAKSAQFIMESAEVQDQRLQGFGSVLANIARSQQFSALKVMERSVITDTDSLRRYFERNRDPSISEDSPLVGAYDELLRTAGSVGQIRQLLVGFEITPKHSTTQKRMFRYGGRENPDQAAGRMLLNEFEGLKERLRRAGVTLEPLYADGLARAFKDAFDPFERPQRDRLQARSEGQAPRTYPWPLTADETWNTYATDSALHKTLWVGEWPRIDVDATFLSPLLLQSGNLAVQTGGQSVRTFSVVMQPIRVTESVRQAESAVRQDQADEAIKRRWGFLPSTRRKKQSEAASDREKELAVGHAELRTVGYITVSATDQETLEEALSDVQDAAQLSHLETYELGGEQATAFCASALPLCRGV